MANKFLDLTGLSYFWNNDKRFKNTSSTGDLNNIKYTCIKYVVGASNTPPQGANYGIFVCIVNDAKTYGVQFYKGGNVSSLYKRNLQGGTWGTWVRMPQAFTAGDNINVSRFFICAGETSADGKTVYFTMPLAEPIYDTNGITPVALSIYIRGEATSIDRFDVLADTTISTSVTRAYDHLNFALTKTTAWGLGNKKPITVEITADSNFNLI